MKRNVRVFSVVACALFAIVFMGAEKAKPAAKPAAAPVRAKIGVISILTGQGAGYGEAITNGIKLARDEVNAKGEVIIELKIEDSSAKQEQALAAGQKLINSEKVVAILGPTLSNEMKVVGPEANASGVPIMGTSTTAKGITQIGKFVFRNSLPESQAIPASVGKAVKKYNIRKVALFYGNDDVFTKSGFDTMKEVSEKLKLQVLTVQEFQKGQADYKAQLTRIASLKPDAVFCSALYEEGGVILSQARKMGLNVPFVGGNGFNSPKVIDIAKDAAEGLIVATPWFVDRNDPKVKAFVAKYEKAYGKKPDQFAAQAYDALYIMADALKRAGKADRTALRDALASTRNFQGVLGTFSFDAERDVVMEPNVLIIKGGKFQIFN
ncbi:MAG: branched-chain amino acid transporter substrate-binding protein [Deltaproteobacteria bacterium]|nr:branched-chain amino acid transporter substrate-binding protein [Deltaproteobacteria bacterium]MBP2682836.1 branched-chain amino acid transporter substrate-binding protein [Deltaproteobacteria bacterium]